MKDDLDVQQIVRIHPVRRVYVINQISKLISCENQGKV